MPNTDSPRADLDDLAKIHDGDTMAEAFDHRHVVRNEQQRNAELLLQVHEQVADLRLDRHVERRNAFIGDDDLGIERERPGDADALALPAGEFVRIALHHVGAEPDLPQQLGRLLARRIATGEAMLDDRFGHRRADRHARIEARERVLEDHLDAAAHRAQLRRSRG